jgi:hypothetical protein
MRISPFNRAKAGVTLDLGAGLEAVFRIEGQLAVIEFPDRTTKDVPLNDLSNELKPGDCFWYSEGHYVSAPEETVKRQAKMKELMKSMWND